MCVDILNVFYKKIMNMTCYMRELHAPLNAFYKFVFETVQWVFISTMELLYLINSHSFQELKDKNQIQNRTNIILP